MLDKRNDAHIVQLHLTIFVADQSAERDFYQALGFEIDYTDDVRPGLLTLSTDDGTLGLAQGDDLNPSCQGGVRLVFTAHSTAELKTIIDRCQKNCIAWAAELGDGAHTERVQLSSPNGVEVWFEHRGD